MASIDEAYLDITGCLDLHKMTAAQLAKAILFDVNKELNISVSCGLASNKTVAKIASSTNKPHKLTVVPFGKEADFLAPLSLSAMPGIGPRTFSVLRAYGLETIGDFAALSLAEIIERFGVNSVPLWKRAQGIDNSFVKSECSAPKSISRERTFYEGHKPNEFYLRALRDLSRDVFARLRGHGMHASTLFLKIRYKVDGGERALFRDFSFQKHLSISTNCDSDLFPYLKDLFLSNLSPHFPVRLVGVGVGNLVKNYNLNLFNAELKGEKIFQGVDKICEIYGNEVLRYGV
jgi:DNA polymerase-4